MNKRIKAIGLISSLTAVFSSQLNFIFIFLTDLGVDDFISLGVMAVIGIGGMIVSLAMFGMVAYFETGTQRILSIIGISLHAILLSPLPIGDISGIRILFLLPTLVWLITIGTSWNQK